jgi:hypothetical protein
LKILALSFTITLTGRAVAVDRYCLGVTKETMKATRPASKVNSKMNFHLRTNTLKRSGIKKIIAVK